MQKKWILNTLSSNSVEKEKEKNCSCKSLASVSHTETISKKSRDFFAHLKVSILTITSRKIKRNMRIIPSRLLKIQNAIYLSFFLRAENLSCNGRNNPGSAIAHSKAVPEHHISFHREKTTQAFIQNMSCLHSSLAGS